MCADSANSITLTGDENWFDVVEEEARVAGVLGALRDLSHTHLEHRSGSRCRRRLITSTVCRRQHPRGSGGRRYVFAAREPRQRDAAVSAQASK